MAVPDTNTFSLQDVVDEINPTTDDLQDCVDDANSGDYDTNYYTAPATSLLEFRNYGNTPVTIPSNPNYLLSSMTDGSSTTLSWTTIPPFSTFLGGFTSADGRHGIVVLWKQGTYYIGYYSYNIAFQSNQAYNANSKTSIVGQIASSIGVCSISKDQRRIQVFGENSSGTKICETIYLTDNLPGFGIPDSVSQSTVSTFTNTNFNRTSTYVSKMSNNLFGYVAVDSTYAKQLFIGRNLYSSSSAASANFGGFVTSFNRLEDGFMDGTGQSYFNPIATIGDQDEYVFLYDNTANNTDKLYMYKLLSSNSLDESTEQTYFFGNFSDNSYGVTNIIVPTVDKLILYISRSSTQHAIIQITDKNTNF